MRAYLIAQHDDLVRIYDDTPDAKVKIWDYSKQDVIQAIKEKRLSILFITEKYNELIYGNMIPITLLPDFTEQDNKNKQYVTAIYRTGLFEYKASTISMQGETRFIDLGEAIINGRTSDFSNISIYKVEDKSFAEENAYFNIDGNIQAYRISILNSTTPFAIRVSYLNKQESAYLSKAKLVLKNSTDEVMRDIMEEAEESASTRKFLKFIMDNYSSYSKLRQNIEKIELDRSNLKSYKELTSTTSIYYNRTYFTTLASAYGDTSNSFNILANWISRNSDNLNDILDYSMDNLENLLSKLRISDTSILFDETCGRIIKFEAAVRTENGVRRIYLLVIEINSEINYIGLVNSDETIIIDSFEHIIKLANSGISGISVYEWLEKYDKSDYARYYKYKIKLPDSLGRDIIYNITATYTPIFHRDRGMLALLSLIDGSLLVCKDNSRRLNRSRDRTEFVVGQRVLNCFTISNIYKNGSYQDKLKDDIYIGLQHVDYGRKILDTIRELAR